MPPLPIKQRTPEWHAARRGRMTASLGAAALGFDPHNSKQKAVRSILGEKTQENRFMRWGSEGEPLALAAYEALTGQFVLPGNFWIHPRLDWLGASPDGFVEEMGLVEIKCPVNLPERVPVHHRIQMLLQMEVCEAPFCDYFAWTPNGHFLQRVYPLSAHGTAALLRRLEAFYRTYVLTHTQPPRKQRRKKVSP